MAINHPIHDEYVKRFTGYLKNCTNLKEQHADRHARNMADLAFTTLKIYKEVKHDDNHTN